MKSFYIPTFFALFIIFSCSTNSNNSSGTEMDLSGYQTEELNGATYAYKVESTGVLVSEGFLSNGKKHGSWISYYPNDGKIKDVENYVNGTLNGVTLTFSNRGSIDKREHFRNGRRHGMSGEYKFGRPIKETEYSDGKLNGVHKEYFNNGKLQKEVTFKNDLQHGSFKQYNEEGEVIIQYEYENGKKLSGGVVETKEE